MVLPRALTKWLILFLPPLLMRFFRKWLYLFSFNLYIISKRSKVCLFSCVFQLPKCSNHKPKLVYCCKPSFCWEKENKTPYYSFSTLCTIYDSRITLILLFSTFFLVVARKLGIRENQPKLPSFVSRKFLLISIQPLFYLSRDWNCKYTFYHTFST